LYPYDPEIKLQDIYPLQDEKNSGHFSDGEKKIHFVIEGFNLSVVGNPQQGTGVLGKTLQLNHEIK